MEGLSANQILEISFGMTRRQIFLKLTETGFGGSPTVTISDDSKIAGVQDHQGVADHQTFQRSLWR
jgi:hypothetical protein